MRIELVDNYCPQIFICPTAMQKMQAYTKLSDKEIGWLGHTSKMSNHQYLITDVFLLEQEVTYASCDLKPTAILSLYEERMEAGEDVDDIKMWGHSHVNMAVGASAQDITQFEELYSNFDDYFIRLIMNKKNEFNISFIDIKRGLLFHELPYSVYFPTQIDEDAISSEIKQKVTQRPIVVKTYKNKNFHGYGVCDDIFDEELYYERLSEYYSKYGGI